MRKWILALLFLLILVACQVTPAATPEPPTSTLLVETDVPLQSPTTPPTATPVPTGTATATPFPAGPWKLVAVHDALHNVMAAGFLNEDFGITVGTYPGLPFTTIDGGKTWTAGSMQADCRYGLDIVDTKVAWASGGAMNVRHTNDGGTQWPPVSDYGLGTTRPFHTISFLDDLTGWEASLYMFGSTRDGGATWSDVPQPQGLNDIAAVLLAGPGTGYLLDFSGVLYSTRDNGSQWTILSRLDLEDLVIPKAAYQMAAMRFYGPGEGLIVVSEEYQAGKVKAFHTSDGGRSWTSEFVPVMSGPVFLSRQEPLLTVITAADILTLLRYEP